jgi:hypothetical protein
MGEMPAVNLEGAVSSHLAVLAANAMGSAYNMYLSRTWAAVDRHHRSRGPQAFLNFQPGQFLRPFDARNASSEGGSENQDN